jgi:hypothetical protein
VAEILPNVLLRDSSGLHGGSSSTLTSSEMQSSARLLQAGAIGDHHGVDASCHLISDLGQVQRHCWLLRIGKQECGKRSRPGQIARKAQLSRLRKLVFR